ncbi:ABC transporter permease [Pseudonocardia oroxyli]|uniref:Peptide/nickel transport system permease protein n=1 Tax=Pseudonocardia oroxyli TaxID=366584 RepID=A0A1G8C8X9_PSEOR|nr:ABC transporter permease [Pseudonocardia oroxyli]SDH41350.1 peptide/nickel transport system permease protein [Pseudonocardia oroxyli]
MSRRSALANGGYGRYLARRAVQGVFVLWAAFTLSFVVLYLMPSDPVSIMLNATGDGVGVDPAAVAALRAEHHLDSPLVVQYLFALGDAVRGDFGTSIPTGEPVSRLIAEALPQTLQLTALSFVLAVVFGGGLALLSTSTGWRPLRQALLSLPPLGVSVPTFWVGLILLQVFSFRAQLFPATGNAGFPALVLPAITLAVPTGAVFAQVLAKNLAAAWRSPYVETARAKGLGRTRIQLRHALRNGSIPVLTIIGITVGQMLAGAVVVETVFSRNGIGRLTEESVAAQDIPVIQGLVVLSALVFVLVNLVVDAIYPLVDPRIGRLERRRVARTEEVPA